jgi:hypothetical protein
MAGREAGLEAAYPWLMSLSLPLRLSSWLL